MVDREARAREADEARAAAARGMKDRGARQEEVRAALREAWARRRATPRPQRPPPSPGRGRSQQRPGRRPRPRPRCHPGGAAHSQEGARWGEEPALDVVRVHVRVAAREAELAAKRAERAALKEEVTGLGVS